MKIEIDYIKTLIFTYKATGNIAYLRQAKSLVINLKDEDSTFIMAA
jgi:hypothetical protein